MSKFQIIKDVATNVRRFNLRGRKVEFKIKPTPIHEDPFKWFREGLREILQHVTLDVHPYDMIGFTFCGKSFEERGPGWLNYKKAQEVTFEDVWSVLFKIFQSNSNGLNTDSFCLGVTTVRLPKGKGKRIIKYNTFNEECAKRRGIVSVNNKDNLCLIRALVVAKANVDKDPNYRNIRLDYGKAQTTKAMDLMKASNVTISKEGGGIPELRQLQQFLKEYQIIVYQHGSKGRDIVFEGPEAERRLNLLYYQGHYNVIVSLTAAFCCSYYCEQCHTPYNAKNKHRCGGTCPCCQQTPSCVQSLQIKCEICNRRFRGQICFLTHLKKGTLGKGSVCEQLRQCIDCLKTVKTDREHVCGEIFCKICVKHQPHGHMCHIQPDTRAPVGKDTLFIFYDLETIQDTGEHIPNLCVYQQRCDVCINEKQLYFCQKCGFRCKILKDINTVIDTFMLHILEQRKKFKRVVVIAHNGGGFDNQFILNHILTKTALKPELIMRGTKIIMMGIDNVKFLDSLNYFPMALAKLPKAFDLGDNFKKGYFPHLFNIEENKSYVGPMPSIQHYSPDTMKEDERAAFLRWYEEHKEDTFDMQRDIAEYCLSDVEILTAACLKFRKMMLEECNVCPFTEACTIASACNLLFRRNFLHPETIGIIPKRGYRLCDNQSQIALQWLVLEEKNRNIHILHAGNGQEAVVKGVKVDGYCPKTNQIWQMQGCYHHGCPKCLKYKRDDPLHDDPNDTLNRRYESTRDKTERLRNFGYEVVEMWECVFRQKLDTDEQLREFSKTTLTQQAPLVARDALSGGRTEAYKLYYKVKPGEQINYVDVCSLYPWVCKYGKFPVGHPKVYVDDDCPTDLTEVDGLIKCKILPPVDLYHPVLAIKTNNKLLFSLCRTCAETLNKDKCTHNVEERALEGTWVMDEVRKAMDVGYTILKTNEIWAYDVLQQSEASEGLFTQFINKFLVLKQQASGWPSNCVLKEEKDKYVEQFFNMEGVKMEFTQILKNAGLRALAKLILNSFWGKFGQRENQTKTSIINQPAELFELLTTPSLEVGHIIPVNDNTLIVNWMYIDEAADSLPSVNVCIASYVTAQARLKLYTYLEMLDQRVLYCDTDSVIFVTKPGDIEVPTGEFLGEMTDELEKYGPGSYITEFCSGGPKLYAYKTFSPTTGKENIVCKAKGININYKTSKQVNFETLRDMIIEDHLPEYIVTSNIRRTAEHKVINKLEEKVFKPTFSKRKREDDYDSTPYGFKRSKT